MIYHYTNIESLALILESKSIRFNRLDLMDDLEEGQVESQGIPLGKYAFVSCWTETQEESIPLWKMYTHKERGVRLGLPMDMFKDHSLVDLYQDWSPRIKELANVAIGDMGKMKIPMSEYVNKKYLVYPVPSTDLKDFYKKITYVDDVFQKTNGLAKRYCNQNDQSAVGINLTEVGIYKHTRWEFQNESRFIVYILPSETETSLMECAKMGQKIYEAIDKGLTPEIKSFYLPLKDDIFNNLEITLSPSITSGQRVLINSLMQQYAPNALIKESSLLAKMQ